MTHFYFQRRLWAVLIITIFFFANFANASDEVLEKWNELNEKVADAYYQGKYREGIRWAEKTLDHAQKYFGPEDQKTLAIINNLAMLYIQNGIYDKAEPLVKRALPHAQKHFESEGQIILTNINALAMHYLQNDIYDKAEPLLKKALELCEKKLGPDHPDTFRNIKILGILYIEMVRYRDAEPLYQKALEFREKKLGPDHPDTLQDMNMLGELYIKMGRYKDAERLLRKAFKLRKKVLGISDPNTLINLNNLSLLYIEMGRYKDAEPLCQSAWTLCEKILGPQDPSTLISLNNLSLLYSGQGFFKKAIQSSEKELALSKKVLGPEHPDTLTSMNNLASFYMNDGNWHKAEELYQEALTLHKKVVGPEHPDTLLTLNNLGGLYIKQGRYGEAETLIKDVLKLRKRVLTLKHTHTLDSLNDLGGLYKFQERYKEAEQLLRKALDLSKQVLGPKHPKTLITMSGLGILYEAQRHYTKAEPLLQTVLDIRKEVLPPGHPATLGSMSRLAGLYTQQNRYGEAEALFKETLELSKNVPEHPDTLLNLNKLAFLYRKQGRYKEAESLYRQALTLRKKVLKPEHPDTLTTQLSLADCLIKLKQPEQALPLLREMETWLQDRTAAILYTTQKQRVRNRYLLSSSTLQNVCFSLAMEYDHQDARTLAADVLFRWRQIQSDEDAYIARLVQTSDDPEIIRLASNIMNLRSHLSHTTFGETDNNNRAKLIEALETEEAELAKEVRRKNDQKLKKDDQRLKKVRNANTAKIRSSLPPGSALLEIRAYLPVNFKTGEWEKLHWAAVCLLADAEDDGLIFADFGSASKDFELFNNMRDAENKKEAAEAKKREAKKNKDAEKAKFYAVEAKKYMVKANEYAADLYKNLYRNLISPLEEHLKQVSTLYIAPDSFLNLVAFSRLILPDGRYLAERYELRQIQTGRDLLREQAGENDGSLLALGGVDFDHFHDQEIVASKAQNPLPQTDEDKKKAVKSLKPFDFLLGSEREVKNIVSKFKHYRKNASIQPLSSTGASETALKSIKAAPAIMHLSTHGFFLDGKIGIERPMILSGLALAGANQGIKGKTGKDNEDGILFAMEVLGLNLKGSELVCLSACETGKGSIDYSEGVYGLVRAFRIAGAKSVLMTLWQVGQLDARKFITKFYKNLLKQPENAIDPAKALHETRLSYIRKKADPKIWAAYVLIGK